MEISTEKRNNWHIVSLTGKMMITEIKNVRKEFETLEKFPDTLVAIDFTNTLFIDSSSISLLLNFQNNLKKQNGMVVGFAANSDIQDIFELVHLDEYIPLYKTFEEIEKKH